MAVGRGYFKCLCVWCRFGGRQCKLLEWARANVIGSVETKPPASSPVKKKKTTVCVSVSGCVVGTGERAARRAVHTHVGGPPFRSGLGLVRSGLALKHWPAGDWRFQV